MSAAKNELAIFGGTAAKTAAYTKGPRFGKAEEDAAVAAIRSQKLWMKQGGTRVLAVEKTICELWGVPHAIACSSGTAALHLAAVVCGVEPGDEVILNPTTDWGTICGLLAMGAVPVFADVHPDTLSLDPARVAEAITSRTRAIILVHLAGYPAHVKEIVALAKERGVKVIEDCAQSPLARVDGQPLGTFGDVGTFSANDSKHVSCGEGGFVTLQDEEMARVGRLFIDKAYERNKVRGQTDVTFLGFNYRLSELSAAVLDVQLRGLEEQIRGRTAYAERLMAGLDGLKGLRVLSPLPGARGAYWFVLSCLEPQCLSADRATVAKALAAEGVAVWAALSPANTLYGTTALREKRLYPWGRTAPASFLGDRQYAPGLCPVAEHVAANVLSFLVNPFYTEQDADETAAGVRKVLEYYRTE
ncbi:MAG: DegT/DnrJ/EryC1/StrS family aminotransferase [Planctomycetes bacterium]|nr:DegT/DnrJ/EryC1/StrS family aminotransferase [Planctomycetota bacterium]